LNHYTTRTWGSLNQREILYDAQHRILEKEIPVVPIPIFAVVVLTALFTSQNCHASARPEIHIIGDDDQSSYFLVEKSASKSIQKYTFPELKLTLIDDPCEQLYEALLHDNQLVFVCESAHITAPVFDDGSRSILVPEHYVQAEFHVALMGNVIFLYDETVIYMFGLDGAPVKHFDLSHHLPPFAKSAAVEFTSSYRFIFAAGEWGGKQVVIQKKDFLMKEEPISDVARLQYFADNQKGYLLGGGLGREPEYKVEEVSEGKSDVIYQNQTKIWNRFERAVYLLTGVCIGDYHPVASHTDHSGFYLLFALCGLAKVTGDGQGYEFLIPSREMKSINEREKGGTEPLHHFSAFRIKNEQILFYHTYLGMRVFDLNTRNLYRLSVQ